MGLKLNPLKVGLRAKRVQLGTWINLVYNPSVLTLLKSAGLDFARLDIEDCAPSMDSVACILTVSRALDFPVIVRPPAANREWITRLLDAGAWGLHIPQVDTPEIARAVVAAARFAPLGQRGIAGFGPHVGFEPLPDIAAALKHLNDQVRLSVMLESRQAFDHLDETVATPGIDGVTLGPSDLAQDLGIFGSPDQGRIINEYRQRLVETARKYHKDLSFLVNSVEEAERWIRAGVTLLVYASDVEILHAGYTGIARKLHG
jgi:2-keto-3-deoxy-L-rhamnonate aldolase RhmA